MNSNSIIILGFDGYSKSVIDSIVELDVFDEIVVLDKQENIGKTFSYAKVVGDISMLQKYYDDGYRVVYIGNENDLNWRREMALKSKRIGFSFATIIDKSAMVAEDVTLGQGVYVAKGAIINPSVTVGENVIVNVGTVVQSDSVIGEYSRLSAASVISEGAKVGSMCYIGAKSVVEEFALVPDDAVVEEVSVWSKK